MFRNGPCSPLRPVTRRTAPGFRNPLERGPVLKHLLRWTQETSIIPVWLKNNPELRGAIVLNFDSKNDGIRFTTLGFIGDKRESQQPIPNTSSISCDRSYSLRPLRMTRDWPRPVPLRRVIRLTLIKWPKGSGGLLGEPTICTAGRTPKFLEYYRQSKRLKANNGTCPRDGWWILSPKVTSSGSSRTYFVENPKNTESRRLRPFTG